MALRVPEAGMFAKAQLIDGVLAAGEGARFIVDNPGTEELVAELRGASLAQVDRAIMAARRAFDHGGWSDIGVAARAQMLSRFIAALAARATDIQDLIVREAGCPVSSAMMHVQVHVPVKQAGELLDYVQRLPEIEENPLPLRERVNAFGQTLQSLKQYTPIGVVAAISAYNFPLFTALWKIMPALATGNTVILRPSPLTPLTSIIIAEAACVAGLPPGVLNIVIEGGHEGGQRMTTHPAVDMVAFTGSTPVGKQIMVQAADTMKRLQLELGGKSAQIFLSDALDVAAGAPATLCTAQAGQGCAVGSRIFVPEVSKPAVLRAMADNLAKIITGDPVNPATTMGPVISAAQQARCEHYVAGAVQHGARLVHGGKRPAHCTRGYFFEPTLLDVPDNANPAAQAEIFGPVVAVIGYRDVEHAIAMANDSAYGLSGYVFGKDKAAALRVAARIKTGTVNINGGGLSTYVSSGGQRLSGFGRERGLEGVRIYQQLTVLNLAG
jgi:aldehyde dehydrogenase (NAD+)